MPSISLKAYLIAAAVLVVVVVLGIGAWRLYSDGEARISALNRQLATSKEIHNVEVESRAQILLAADRAAYQAAVTAPVISVPSLVCIAPAAGAGAVPDHASAASRGDAAAAVPAESSGPPFNPAPGVLANDRAADAQVAELQAYVKHCQAMKVCAKK